jgi:hypothetical protein
MSDPTTPVGDEYAGNPVIDEAERQLRAFAGDNIDRADAARFLQSWERYSELTASDVAELLDRFGPKPGATQ